MSTAQELKQLGNAAFQAKNFEEAILHFTNAIAVEPTDHVLYSNRSGAYASMQKYDKALEDAEECIRLSPQWAKGYSRKGLTLSNLGRYTEAIEAYEYGLTLDPSSAALQTGLEEVKKAATNNIQSSTFDMQVALTLMKDPKFEQYIKDDPDYLRKVTGIARQAATERNVQQLQLAMSIVNDHRVKEGLAKLFGIELPEEPQPTATKPSAETAESTVEETNMSEEEAKAEQLKEEGNKHYKLRHFEEALKCYQEAQELNPRQILYLNNEAAVYLEQNEFDLCIATCQKALDKKGEVHADFTSVAKVYNRLATCYKKMGDLEKSIEMYKKSLIEDNDRKVRQTLRETERLLEEKRKQEYIDPEKAEEHKAKGNEFFKNKDYPQSKLEYDEAIKRNPKDAKLYSNRAAAYIQLLEYPSALRDAEKATELDPSFVKGWSRKGTCHYKLKEYHKAIAAFQRGLEVDPDNLECQKGLRETMMTIQMNQSSKNVDEEQVNRALGDPEIQEIIRDPQFQMILQRLQQDPSLLKDYLGDPKVMDGLQKLMAAGILRTA
eukprot:Gregarina_sp_Poly_1__11023@NODE_87_length_15225_cov_52_775630_g75_i0_p3_GENE_NODE_87_length_15225_cov_52_775630_g75_i0NODE_87_length_15225_cov_52_775630_g75_i0_p3_ORF_typecomplete_len550_score113_69TPR_1/PF00515_28/0_00015TPR_1/PF00515_28/0_0023TPR_1/PF00515_28/6_6e07TPR_1/PF00515_28/1_8e05TPR_1/PF00515_28/0_07TPR_1/PF00515_28/6_8e06TPR_1/PF00515_28/0_0084TPR_1/PF00515_28/4_8e05TPR_1/PF00515_28/6_5e09TPR_2/PF07719_17/4_6e07TPR_2/PF07719_17/0_0072TPR_2/PF07719_17/3_2e06TPR_2/PF07719_17/1_4e06TPR_